MDKALWFTWLTTHRNKALILLTDTYTILSRQRKNSRMVDGWFAGLAFCLWRAVFLLEKNQSANRDYITPAKVLFEKLISTNSISFDAEFKSSNWSAGFYLGGAEDRLGRLIGVLEKKEKGQGEFISSFDADDLNQVRQWRSQLETAVKLPLHDRWIRLYNLTYQLIIPYMNNIKLTTFK